MNKFILPLLGVLLGAMLVLFFKPTGLNLFGTQQVIQSEASVIEKSISQISKLMVAEGHFSEIYTHRDKKSYFYELFAFEKKAILIVNAKVLVGYDLSKMNYELNESQRTVFIQSIPKAEVEIIPDLSYYDIQESDFHKFTPEEMNSMNQQAIEAIEVKVNSSDLFEQGEAKIMESLDQLEMVIEAMGWKLDVIPELLVSPEMQ